MAIAERKTLLILGTVMKLLRPNMLEKTVKPIKEASSHAGVIKIRSNTPIPFL